MCWQRLLNRSRKFIREENWLDVDGDVSEPGKRNSRLYLQTEHLESTAGGSRLAGLCYVAREHPRRGSQVVRQRSAKPLFGGSIPPRASNNFPSTAGYVYSKLFSGPNPT